MPFTLYVTLSLALTRPRKMMSLEAVIFASFISKSLIMPIRLKKEHVPNVHTLMFAIL